MNLNKISIAKWFEVLETGNIKLLENCTPEIFEKLYDDFFNKLDNKQAQAHLQKSFNKSNLVLKVQILTNCYENLCTIYNFGTKIENVKDLEKKLIDTINLLFPKTKIIGNIENKLQIIEKLIKITNLEFSKIVINENEKDTNFNEQIVHLELILNLSIDAEKTSVSKYIEYVKLAKLKSKANENGRS